MSFEAMCAQLGKLGAVAASAGVVWGQVKGYPFWPVRAGGGAGWRVGGKPAPSGAGCQRAAMPPPSAPHYCWQQASHGAGA